MRQIIATKDDIPSAEYSLKINITKKPVRNALPERIEYSDVVKVDIIDDDLLEIFKASEDEYATIFYYHIRDIRDFNISFIGTTDEDDKKVDKYFGKIILIWEGDHKK